MKVFLTTVFLFVVAAAHATQQYPDILIWNNDTLKIYDSPLEKVSPELTKEILTLNDTWETSACWRGYIATWSIIDNKLYLTEIINAKDSSDLKWLVEKVSTKKFESGKLDLSITNDQVWCNNGAVYDLVLFGYYEEEFLLIFEKGVLIRQTSYKSNQCIFETREDSIRIYTYSNINWKKLSINDSKDYRVRVYIKTDNDGNIIQCHADDMYEYKKNRIAYEEVMRVLKTLPCIKTYVYKGEILTSYFLSLPFNKELQEQYERK